MRTVLLSLILCCFLLGCFFLQQAQISMSCEAELQRIISRKNLNISEQIKQWKRFESKCSFDGFYQDALVKFYMANKAYKAALFEQQKILEYAELKTKERLATLAGILFILERFESLKPIGEELVEKFPNWSGGYNVLGDYYMCKQQWDLSKKQNYKASKLNPYDIIPLLQLSLTSYYTEDYDNTINYYRRACMIAPDGAFLSRNVSTANVIVSVKRKDFKNAKNILDNQKLYDKTVEEDPLYQKSLKLYETEFAKYQNETLK